MTSSRIDRGDIVRLSFPPAGINELEAKPRLALVLSQAAFNELGLAYVAPIMQSGDYARHAGFAVRIAIADDEAQGAALVNQIRVVDLFGCGACVVAKVPSSVLDDALARWQAIVGLT